MSFFGGLIKGVVKVASAIGGAAIKQSPIGKVVGLSKGIVENLKGAKRARLDPSTVPATNQTRALAAKLQAPSPRVMITAYQPAPGRKLRIRRAPRAPARIPSVSVTARAPRSAPRTPSGKFYADGTPKVKGRKKDGSVRTFSAKQLAAQERFRQMRKK
jgi:hypothetical protein